MGVLLCSSVCQALDGPASLMFSCQCWCVGRERLWSWLHPIHMTQQYRLASMAAWLSSTGISHHNLLPHFPWSVSLQLTAAVTLGLLHNPYAPPPSCCPFKGNCVPIRGTYGCGKDWFSFHLGCHRSVVSLLALNVSPLTQTIAPKWEWDPCFSSPTRWGQVWSYWHSCFFPLAPWSYWVLCGSTYSFPVVRYPCLLSAGVLQALLCLKVYFWCICGGRCIPHPPTPPPSCSPPLLCILATSS